MRKTVSLRRVRPEMTYAVAHMPSRLSTGSALWKTSLYPSSKGDQDRLRPQPFAEEERVVELALSDRAIPMLFQPPHLTGEVDRMHRQGPVGRRRRGVSPVVHEDRNPELAVRRPRARRERQFGLCVRTSADRRARGCAGDPCRRQRRYREE